MTRADERVDVAIAGAGAAGALIAARLATAGRSVVVLEAGPGWALSDLVSSQLWSRRLKWGGAPVGKGGADPVGHNMASGWGLGGAALHHYAGWPRLHPEDFTLASDHGVGRDWPFGYDALRPHYDRVQAEMGVAGDAAAEPWRPPGDPYPLPPLKWFRQGEVLKAGFERLGMRVGPHPMAVTSIEWRDRPGCQYDGWCDAGCPIGAIPNPHILHLPAAIAAGAVVRADAAVTQVRAARDGVALHWRDAAGAEHVQSARAAVLAGAAVGNARLLLASDGLGDRSGLLGRWFAAHAVANAHGLFDEETECWRGLSAGTLMTQDDYGKRAPGRPLGSVMWGIAPAVKPNDLLGVAMTRPDLFGPALANFMVRASRRLGVINGIVEGLPMAENRIELAPRRDRHGTPLARVVHAFHPESAALWAHANAVGLKVMRAAGAGEAWTTPSRAYSHLSGGTVMGTSAETSVTDGHGRLWGAPGVWVAGAGLFPSIGAVSPTFTVLALADRTAAALAASL